MVCFKKTTSTLLSDSEFANYHVTNRARLIAQWSRDSTSEQRDQLHTVGHKVTEPKVDATQPRFPTCSKISKKLFRNFFKIVLNFFEVVLKFHQNYSKFPHIFLNPPSQGLSFSARSLESHTRNFDFATGAAHVHRSYSSPAVHTSE